LKGSTEAQEGTSLVAWCKHRYSFSIPNFWKLEHAAQKLWMINFWTAKL
jgi:hypothetical protein